MMKKSLMMIAVMAAFGSVSAYATGDHNPPTTPPGCSPSGNTPQKCDGGDNNTGGVGLGVGVGLGYGEGGTGIGTGGNSNATGGGGGSAVGVGGNSSSNGTNTSTNSGNGFGGQGGEGGRGGSATGGNATQGQQQANLGINGQSSENTVKGGDQTVNSTNNGTVKGTNTSSQDASTKSGSNNIIDASTRSSYVAKSIALPPVIHGQAAPPLASASMTVIPGVCGPRHYTETTPVKGTHHGILWDSEVPQGNDYTAVPAAEPFLQKNGYLIGHMLNEYVAVVGTSSSKSISGWGVGKEQNGGGGGAANSGSHQQIVVRITIKDCIMPVKEVVAPVVSIPRDLPIVPSVRE